MNMMPIITVPYEGGYYSLNRDNSAPIRIYPNRWLEDDIYAKISGKLRRERLTRKEFKIVKQYAKLNRKDGQS